MSGFTPNADALCAAIDAVLKPKAVRWLEAYSGFARMTSEAEIGRLIQQCSDVAQQAVRAALAKARGDGA